MTEFPYFLKRDNLFYEKLLLVILSKLMLTEKDIEEINSIALLIKNWDAASYMAKTNGIAAIVLKNINNKFINNISSSFIKSLQKEAQQIKYKNAVKLIIMNEIVNSFRKENLNFIVIKGYQFIRRYYFDPFIRDIGDIDFLIPKKDFEKAVNIMNKNEKYELMNLPYAHHKIYYHNKFGIAIELHNDLISKPHYFKYDINEFFNNIIFFTDNELSSFILNDYYEFYLQLISSLYSHSFLPFKVRNIVDIQAIMLTIYPFVDWKIIESKTKEMGCFNYLLLAWKICNQFYNLTPPENLNNYLSSKWFNKKYSLFLSYLFHYLEYLLDKKHQQNLIALQLAFADTFRKSFSLFYHYIILPPDYVRVAKIHLKIPIPLYLIIRIITLPFRSIYKFFYIYFKSLF